MEKLASKRSFELITKKWAIQMGICISPLFFGFAYFDDPGRGLASYISGAMIAVTARYFWDLKKRVWFWATIVLFIVLHISVVTFLQWPDLHYTYVQLLPIGFLDFGIMYGIIRLVEHFFDNRAAT